MSLVASEPALERENIEYGLFVEQVKKRVILLYQNLEKGDHWPACRHHRVSQPPKRPTRGLTTHYCRRPRQHKFQLDEVETRTTSPFAWLYDEQAN
jgi:hypothetical protein